MRGREERIEEGLTWREKKMMWRLKEIAGREEREGMKAWVRYERTWMEGKWR